MPFTPLEEAVPDEFATPEAEQEFTEESAPPPMTIALPRAWLATAESVQRDADDELPYGESPLLRALPPTVRVTPRRPIAVPMVARVKRSAVELGAPGDAAPLSAPPSSRNDTTSAAVEMAARPVAQVDVSQAPAQSPHVAPLRSPTQTAVALPSEAVSPRWPFTFVTPSIARMSATEPVTPDFVETESWAPVSAIAPMVVRRSTMPASLAQVAPGLPALSSPVRPAGQMLVHVPRAELELGREIQPLVQRSPAIASQETASSVTPVFRVARAQRQSQTNTERISNALPPSQVTPAPAESPVPIVPPLPIEPVMSHAITREWPVLPYVQRLAAPEPSEAVPAAVQVLRQRSPQAQRNAMALLSALPSLGRGAALPDEVRRPMETILRRNLSNVETHESPAAEDLGAEAFTSGQHIVFAPGRLDYRSARGLAVVGHELTHIGQPLAFREWSPASTLDAAEDRARQQETQIEQQLTQNWPNAPHMEVLQATQALRSLVSRSGAQALGAAGATAAQDGNGPAGGAQPPGGASGGGGAAAGGGRAAQGGGESLPTARLREASPSASGGGGQSAAGAPPDGAQNVDQLAREVYDLLKTRLRGELFRHQLYS